MYFSKLVHGFVKIDTWISPSYYMDLSKLLNGFVKVAMWNCLSCYTDLSKPFHIFLALCQTKPSLDLTKISKLVEVSALN